MSAGKLHATTFLLYARSPARSAKDLWQEMAADLLAAAPQRYSSLIGKLYRLRLNDTFAASQGRQYVRYRTIDVNLRLKRDRPALIDIALGNCVFELPDDRAPVPTASVTETKWVRAATSISLNEHLRWIREFLIDLEDAGWAPEPIDFEPVDLVSPEIETSSGVCRYSPTGLSKILKNPLWAPPSSTIAVVGLDRPYSLAGQLSDRLDSVWRRMLGRSPLSVRTSETEPIGDKNCAALVVIPDNVDLSNRSDLRERIRRWEHDGLRFKLARQSTCMKSYPLQNLCFDLSTLCGAIHWRPRHVCQPAVAFDAGHDTVGRKSRWAFSRVDHELQVRSIRTIDTSLAEHMPTEVTKAFWPGDDVPLVLRDGRLAQERGILEQRANSEQKALWEIKKNPVALLFRGTFDAPTPAKFGDAVVDPHGEVLLQSLPHGQDQAIHPLRLRSPQMAADMGSTVSDLMVHCAAPTLSIYQQSRLPGVVYWADLASKLDHSGWSRVVGRGFGLALVIP